MILPVVEKVDSNTFKYLLKDKNLPIWACPDTCQFYENCIYFVALRGKIVEGAWAVPVMIGENGETIARRSWRLLPYAAPLVYSRTGLNRRSTIEALFKALTQKVEFISLPLAPELLDISIFQNYSAIVEWRHTHVLNTEWNHKLLSAKISNHLRYAKRHLKITKSQESQGFFFERAIANECNEGIQHRTQFARIQLQKGKGYYLSALHNGEIVGQCFIIIDAKIQYLLHMWSFSNKIRGIATALVNAAAQECFSGKPKSMLDLEGSVLPGVDKFFYGFEGNIIPYGFLLWSQDKSILLEKILAEIMPPERIIV